MCFGETFHPQKMIENFYFRFQVDVLKHLDERIMKVTSSGALLRQNVYHTTQTRLR